MGEIERIVPVTRPILQPRPPDRVHPNSDQRRQHHPQEDQVELTSREQDDEAEVRTEPPDEPGSGLDIAV